MNELPAVHYRELQWGVPDPDLGKFDLIIGSDILYERAQAAQLATLVERHANIVAEVVIVDPGRGNSGPFTRALARQGFSLVESRAVMTNVDVAPFHGRLLSYRRDASLDSASAESH